MWSPREIIRQKRLQVGNEYALFFPVSSSKDDDNAVVAQSYAFRISSLDSILERTRVGGCQRKSTGFPLRGAQCPEKVTTTTSGRDLISKFINIKHGLLIGHKSEFALTSR